MRVEAHAHQYRAAVMLTQAQVRVLGCLLEKERTTPDDYPLTANSLMRAANQTTSRNPIVTYDTALVERTLVELKEAGLVRFVFSPSNRATKYRHVLGDAWDCDAEELAVLCLLMLRGPQTSGELKTRSERLAGFGDVPAVESVLGRLAGRSEAMVCRLDRGAGQKEARWKQLVGDEPEWVGPSASGSSSRSERGSAELRVAALEERVELLVSLLVEVRSELGLEVPPELTPTPSTREEQ